MARTISYTLAYAADGKQWDLCKVIFGGDGSYYVTAPYHKRSAATAALVTVCYNSPTDVATTLGSALEIALVEDDEQRLKLTHHPDGFIQFSGHGILSGRDRSGKAKGIGIQSWPLYEPTFGPSFVAAFSDPEGWGRESTNSARTIVFDEASLKHMRWPDITGLTVVGFYFPVRWREFVYSDAEGSDWIDIVHPNAQAVKHLRVLLASKESDFPGLLGLEVQPSAIEAIDPDGGFYLSSSSGNVRWTAKGDLLGDQLVCMYPAMDMKDAFLPTLAPPLNLMPGTESGSREGPPPSGGSPQT
jgi:hypothetical protein